MSIKWSIRFWEEANRTIRFCNFLIPRSILDGLTVCDDYTSTYLKADWKRSVSRPKSEKISSLQLIPLPLGRAFMHLKNGSKIKLFVDDSNGRVFYVVDFQSAARTTIVYHLVFQK